MRYGFLLVVGLSLPVLSAHAYTGNKLLADCDSTAYKQGYCDGYIAGQVLGYDAGRQGGAISAALGSNASLQDFKDNPDAVEAAQMAARYYCLPPKATSGQLRDVVLRDLKDNPERRHFDAALLIWAAVHKAFPCP